MDKKLSDFADIRAVDATEELVRNLLGQGVKAPDISFALAFIATDLGLQMAPSAEHAIAVVTDAIRLTASTHASTGSPTKLVDDGDSHSDEAIAGNPEIFGRTIH